MIHLHSGAGRKKLLILQHINMAQKSPLSHKRTHLRQTDANLPRMISHEIVFLALKEAKDDARPATGDKRDEAQVIMMIRLRSNHGYLVYGVWMVRLLVDFV